MQKIIIYLVSVFVFFSCKQQEKNNNSTTEIVAKKKDEKPLDESITIQPEKQSLQQQCLPLKFRVFLDDPDTTGITNIRKQPKGKIIATLDGKKSDYIIWVTKAEKGWFKIENPIEGTEENITLPNNEGWIHGSVIAVDTRNYGQQHLKLLDRPENGKVVTIIKKEVKLKPIDMCNDWIKVKYNGFIGWIEREWLCGNPYTNCS